VVYDPAWDMPRINWQQQGSFEAGEIPLAYEPDAAPLICLPPINEYWLPLILGCLDQLRNPSTWITSTDAALNTALDRANRLMQMLGQRAVCFTYQLQFTSGCVLQFSTDGGATWSDVAGWDANFINCIQNVIIPPIPSPPTPQPPTVLGCNIAGYLAEEIIQLVCTKAVNGYNTSLTQLQFAQDILDTIAYAFPLTAIALTVFHDFYAYVTGATISDFTYASTDPVLWGDVACAIYSAIVGTGYITTGNLGNVISNICGIAYIHADVVTALCSFITNIGIENLRAMQNVAVLDNVDCSGCGTWCYTWDFSASDGGWTNVYTGLYGTHTGGQWQATTSGGGNALIIHKTFTAATITQIEIWYGTLTVDTTSPREIQLGHAGPAVFTGFLGTAANPPITNRAFGVGSIVGDELVINLESGPAGNVSWGTVQRVTIRGVGTSPFGASNC
jgi:hypothetical protein